MILLLLLLLLLIREGHYKVITRLLEGDQLTGDRGPIDQGLSDENIVGSRVELGNNHNGLVYSNVFNAEFIL